MNPVDSRGNLGPGAGFADLEVALRAFMQPYLANLLERGESLAETLGMRLMLSTSVRAIVYDLVVEEGVRLQIDRLVRAADAERALVDAGKPLEAILAYQRRTGATFSESAFVVERCGGREERR